jgi:hypothetical protein
MTGRAARKQTAGWYHLPSAMSSLAHKNISKITSEPESQTWTETAKCPACLPTLPVLPLSCETCMRGAPHLLKD